MIGPRFERARVRSWRSATWALALACPWMGCRPLHGLPAVPIDGGTPLQRAAAQAELIDFERWTGGGRVQIRRVAFEPLDDDYLGFFVNDQVLLDEAIEAVHVRDALRHELCHALDAAERLSGRSALFAQLGAQIDRREAERTRGEGFAVACQHAPLTAYLLAHGCEGEDSLGTDAVSWVVDVVWTGVDPPGEAPRQPPVHLQTETPFSPWLDATVSATTDPGIVYVVTDDGSGEVVWRADRYTGEPIDANVDPVPLPWDGNLYVAAPPLSGLVVPHVSPDGPTVLGLRIAMEGIGFVASRELWRASEAEPWSTIGDGCAIAGRFPFFAGDQAFVGGLQDGLVTWTGLGP